MKLIFLDVDGVLNGHQWIEHAKSTTLCPKCIEHFNRVLTKTGAKVVLSSAWRYMVSGNAMTLKGFAYMLRTHGVAECIDIIGITPPDEEIPDRHSQIQEWMRRHGEDFGVESFVTLDDMHLPDVRLVRCEERVGLTAELAQRVIDLLAPDYSIQCQLSEKVYKS